MKDLIERLTSYKTTIVGIATAIIAVLSLLGYLAPEKKEVAETNVVTIYDSLLAVLGGVSGLILVFSKDSDKKQD